MNKIIKTIGVVAISFSLIHTTFALSSGYLYYDSVNIQDLVSTTTPNFSSINTTSTTATSSIKSPLSIATTTMTGTLNLGAVTTGATTTINMGKIQINGYNSAGTRTCAYIVGTSWVIQNVACARIQ